MIIYEYRFFAIRHIGPRKRDLPKMLKVIGAETMEQLISETIPEDIRLKEDLNLIPLSEQEFLEHINDLAEKNRILKPILV